MPYKRHVGQKQAPIRVLVADDHPIYRQGLVEAIKHRPDLELVGEAETGRRTIELLKELKPDVLVLDMKMPDLDGLDVVRSVIRDELETLVIFLSAYLASATIYEAIEAGAR